MNTVLSSVSVFSVAFTGDSRVESHNFFNDKFAEFSHEFFAFGCRGRLVHRRVHGHLAVLVEVKAHADAATDQLVALHANIVEDLLFKERLSRAAQQRVINYHFFDELTQVGTRPGQVLRDLADARARLV